MELRELKNTVRDLVRRTIETRFNGAQYADLAQTRGYADGYMKALLDMKLVDQKELLSLIGEERRRYVKEVSAYPAPNAA